MSFIFAAIIISVTLGVVCIGGALCESDAVESFVKKAGRKRESFAENALSVLLIPVEAAFEFYERVTR